MFTVTLHTDNDVFQDLGHLEVQRILQEIIHDLTLDTDYTKYRTVHDINGNDVGRWKYARDEAVDVSREEIADAVIAQRKFKAKRGR